MSVKALISDLGNVLVLNHPERGAERFSRLNGRTVEENMVVMGDHPDYWRDECTPKEFAEKYKKEFGLEHISDGKFHESYCDIFEINQPVADLYARVKESNDIVLVALSNAERPRLDWLMQKFPEAFALFGERLTLSYETRRIKPEPEIYHVALRMGNAKPHEAIFIDDRLPYVEAANHLGIRGVQYTTVEALEEDLRAAGLRL